MGRRSRITMHHNRSHSEPPTMLPESTSLPELGNTGRRSVMDTLIGGEGREAAGREFRIAKAREEMQRLSASTNTALIMQCLRKHANGAPELKAVWQGLQQQLRKVSGLPVSRTDYLPEPEPEPEPQSTLDLAEVLRRADETLEHAAKSRYILSRTTGGTDEATGGTQRSRSKLPTPQRAQRPGEQVTERTSRRKSGGASQQAARVVDSTQQPVPVVQQHERNGFRQRQAAAEAKFRQRKERAALAKLKRQEASEEAPETVWRRGLRSDVSNEGGSDNGHEASRGSQSPSQHRHQHHRQQRVSHNRAVVIASPRSGGAASPGSAAEAVLTARKRVKSQCSPTTRELRERLKAAEALIADLTGGLATGSAAGGKVHGLEKTPARQLRPPPRRKQPVDFDTMFDDHTGGDSSGTAHGRWQGSRAETDAELANLEAEQKKWEDEMVAEVEAARQREREARQQLLESHEAQHELRHELVRLARQVPIDPSQQATKSSASIAKIQDEFPILKSTTVAAAPQARQTCADAASLRSKVKLEISAEAVVGDTIRSIRNGDGWGAQKHSEQEPSEDGRDKKQLHHHHLLQSLSQASVVLQRAQADLVSVLDEVSTQPMDIAMLTSNVEGKEEVCEEQQEAANIGQGRSETQQAQALQGNQSVLVEPNGVTRAVSQRSSDTFGAPVDDLAVFKPPEPQLEGRGDTANSNQANGDNGGASGRATISTQLAERALDEQMDDWRPTPKWHDDLTVKLEQIHEHSHKIRRDMAYNSHGNTTA